MYGENLSALLRYRWKTVRFLGPKREATTMLHRVEITDPITGRDIADLNGKPYIVDRGTEEELVIYFESEDTKRQFLDIPVEYPIEYRLNLDNPTDVMVAEG
ncbi:MAG: hypothetical protein WAN46_08340 [Gammaproteobacteria bacterium]